MGKKVGGKREYGLIYQKGSETTYQRRTVHSQVGFMKRCGGIIRAAMHKRGRQYCCNGGGATQHYVIGGTNKIQKGKFKGQGMCNGRKKRKCGRAWGGLVVLRQTEGIVNGGQSMGRKID